MFITSTRHFVVVLLALVSRRADVRLECSQFSGFSQFVLDPDDCRKDDFNVFFNEGEKLMSRCVSNGAVSFSCAAQRTNLFCDGRHASREASWSVLRFNSHRISSDQTLF